jgi:mannose-6-phosphate isomerase-like protein (cupin superfamily)
MLEVMSTPVFQTFEAEAKARGFDEVVPRSWPPLAEAAPHRHDFAVHAFVVSGEMWLTCAGTTRHLRPGDTFELEYAVEHAERYGAEGATYWAARRNAGPG